MPVSAGFDEYQQYSDILSFCPSAVERFSENVMKEKNSSAGEFSQLIVSPEQQNNNKRKSYSLEAPPVKRQRVQPLELRESQAPSFSAYSAFSDSSLSLTPPLTPHLSSYLPAFSLQTHHQDPASYFQYDLGQVSPSYRGQGQVKSAAINFLYEKSVSNVRRWRENGLTVQLFYCAVCQLPVDSEERLRTHIQTRHQDGQSQDRGGMECKGCGKEFISEQAVDRHQQECALYRPYRCQYCARTFLLSVRLRHHQLSCQAGPNPAGLQCKVCCKKFSRRDNYLLHLPVHAFYL